MKRTVHRFLLTLATFLTFTNAFATPGDSARTYVIDPVVVTASQIEALRSVVPNSVSILTNGDLHQSGETSILKTVSAKVPGVFVTERGILGYGVSNGAAGGITIRGVGGSPNTDVLVLTDGRPQLMGLMGHPLPDTYVNSGIERVEVIRGPASLLHGTNAMGGVINLIRQRPSPDGVTVNIGGCYGTFGTEKAEGDVSYGAENAGIGIDANYYETSGQRAYSGFKENNGGVRAWTKIAPTVSLTADANTTGFRSFDPGPESSPAINHWVDVTRGSSGFALENRFASVQGALKAFYNWGIHDTYDGFHSTDNNVGLVLFQGFKLIPTNVTTVGIDYKRYGGKANSGPFSFGEHFVTEDAAYILTQQEVTDALNISAGARINNHCLYGTEVIPQFGVSYKTGDQTTVKGTVGKGFRSPTIRELYLFPAPTPTLEPERMWNYEAGILHTFGENVAAVELTAFISKGTNQIRTLGMYPNLVLSNSGSFVHHGVECAGSYRPDAHLTFDMTYGYLERADQTSASPKHKIHFGGTYGIEHIMFNLGFDYVSGLYGADYGMQPLSDYALLNARVSFTVISGLSLYLAGENLLDRPYQTLYQYPMPGRTAFVGFHWSSM
jgi:iron complex outermembrane receptor protein